MSTNVQKTMKSPISKALFGNGIEPFYYEREKWVLAGGSVIRFHEADSQIQQPIWHAFRSDKQSLAYICTKMGIKAATETFETWYRCVVGGIDRVADLNDGKFTPDAFNNLCTETDCPHRGKLCGRAVGLKSDDVKTIRQLMAGKSMEQAAESLFISLPAVKSRVAKLHEKLGVTNTTAMVTRAASIGIF
jgi:hypothetical protein